MTDEMTGEIVVFPNENTFSLGYTFSYKHHRQGYAFEALSVLIVLFMKHFMIGNSLPLPIRRIKRVWDYW